MSRILVQHVLVFVFTSPVRLVAGLLHRVGLQPDRRRQGLPAEPDVDQETTVVAGHRHRERLMRLRGQFAAGVHPDHPAAEHVDPETQLRQHICHHAVLLEAVAAAAAANQLVEEGLRPQVDNGNAHHRVKVLERDRAVVRGHQRGEHIRRRVGRTGVGDATEVLGDGSAATMTPSVAVVAAKCE
jgi:hypothetical protein